MMREAELEEMEKKWREENERIMQLHPAEAHYPEPGNRAPSDAHATDSADEPPNPTTTCPPEKRPLP